MKLITAVALAIPLLAAESARPPLRSVTAVRHWSVGEVTRVAIEISGEFQFRTDKLHNPERVYFDILNARPSVEGRRLFAEEVSDKFLHRVRVAETVPGVTRVVLDLADGVETSTSQLINPVRLIVELRAAAAPPVISQAPPPIAVPAAIVPPAPKAIARPEAPPAVPGVQSVEAAVTAEPSKSQLASSTVPPAPPDAKPEPVKSADAPAAPAGPPPDSAKAARHLSGSGQSSLIRALGLKVNRIVIDPGHGGHDEGTSGAKGVLEKDLVLDISKRLGELIEKQMHAEVIYTRTDDTFIPLAGRTALANDRKADLFISVHANSSPVPRLAGIETYYLNITESKDALDIAARENATSEESIFELRDALQQITLHNKSEESREFANSVQSSLYNFSLRTNPTERNRGVRKAPFVVLKGGLMPSILVEIGFLSNVREEANLEKPQYRQKLAEALFRGISKYAESLSHFQMALN